MVGEMQEPPAPPPLGPAALLSRSRRAGAAAFKRPRRRPRPQAVAAFLALAALLPACALAFVLRGPASTGGRGQQQRWESAVVRAAGSTGRSFDGTGTAGASGQQQPGRPPRGGGNGHGHGNGAGSRGGGGGSGERRRGPGPQQYNQQQQQARRGGHGHGHGHGRGHAHDQAPPPPAHTRLTGKCYKSLLHAIETHAADVASVEELTDALSRLGRMAPSPEALARIAGDARFDTLLKRITELARQLPPAWAPFVLSNLARFCTPTTTSASAASSDHAPLSPASNPTVRGLLRALQARVDSGLAGLSPIALCTVAYSFARLRFNPRPPPSLLAAAEARGDTGSNASAGGGAAVWWRQLVEAASNRLIEFSAWELCQLLRSLLVVQAALPPGEALLTPAFLTLLLKCAERQLFTTFKARDLEGLATSLTKIQAFHKPDPAFLDALVRAAGPHLASTRPPTIARLLHALSRLDGYAPDPEFLAQAERVCAATAPRWDQSSIALVCQAWAWLRYQPQDATVTALLDAARGMLLPSAGGGEKGDRGGGGGFSAQNLGTLIHSLGELRRCPDDQWMAAFQQAVLARLPEAAPKDVSFFLKGLAKLAYYPGPDFIDALLTALTPHLGGHQGIDLQFIVTSLVGLHHRPPAPFAQAFQARALQLIDADGIGPRDLAIIIWSVAALEVPDSRAFLRELVAAAVAQLRAEQPRWSLPDADPKALSIQERWALTARVRQLRQVYLYAQCQDGNGELKGLAGDLEALGLPPLVEAGLAAGSEEEVLARAQESSFHKEVAEVLRSLGASTRRAVDCFVLDVLIDPRPQSSALQVGAPTLPILLLLHGPSRFLRGEAGQKGSSPRLEAGTAMKQRILKRLSGRRFKSVACVDVWEWARERTREARIELLKSKVGARLLESYLTPPQSSSVPPMIGNYTVAAS